MTNLTHVRAIVFGTLVLALSFGQTKSFASTTGSTDGVQETNRLDSLSIGYFGTPNASILITGGSRTYFDAAPWLVFGVDANLVVTPTPGNYYTIGMDVLLGADKRFSGITLGGSAGVGYILINSLVTSGGALAGPAFSIPIQADIGLPVGKGARIGIQAGYRIALNQSALSGVFVGLKIGMKAHHTRTPLED
jgi:hypothetical protein